MCIVPPLISNRLLDNQRRPGNFNNVRRQIDNEHRPSDKQFVIGNRWAKRDIICTFPYIITNFVLFFSYSDLRNGRYHPQHKKDVHIAWDDGRVKKKLLF